MIQLLFFVFILFLTSSVHAYDGTSHVTGAYSGST